MAGGRQTIAKESATPSPGGLKVVGLRFDFYRDGLRASLALNVMLALTVVILIFAVIYFASRPIEREYFTVDNAGRIVKQEAMDRPHMTDSAILEFAVRAVTESYTFDADNYRGALNRVREYFTSKGHRDFIDSMQPQIKYVVSNVLIASAVSTGAPIISNTSEAGDGGIYAWRIKVPVAITYRTQKESTTVQRMVTLIIVNRPTFETPYGVGISSFLAKDI